MVSPQTKDACYDLIKHNKLPCSFYQTVEKIYYPLAIALMEKQYPQPLLVSINGAQGSGKSTMTSFLKQIIESESKCRVAELSLDDFYLKRDERKTLADEVHPLLRTRGVPGTHDVQLLVDVLEQLKNSRPSVVPKFNKAMDDQCPQNEWLVIEQPVNVILFEGWCNNSPPQSVEQLQKPINELEEYEDASGVWRQFVNENLIEYQRQIFRYTDTCIMLKAPDFNSVFAWRRLQEEKLRAVASGECLQAMNDDELKRFIQHFERITRHTIDTLPAIADIVLPVEKDHSIPAIPLGSK